MSERFIPLALVWLLAGQFIGQSVYVAAPVAVRLWRAQVAAAEAQVRLLLETPLPPEPAVWGLLRPGAGKHRRRRLPWLRIGVAR